MGSKAQLDAVVFDLDGTLLDSVPGIVKSFKHTINHFTPNHGLSDQEIIRLLGRPLYTQMKEISGNDAMAEEMVAYYRKHNIEIIPTMPLFPGIEQALEELHSRKVPMAIVTSKAKPSVDISVKKFGLQKFMQTIVTIEDTPKHKPDPMPLLLCLERMGILPERCVYVGDAVFDIQCAKRAGAKSAAVSWGSNIMTELLHESPDFVFTQPSKMLTDIFGR
jgi:pyrophosphatase PpaX